jgi:hypothetical protein
MRTESSPCGNNNLINSAAVSPCWASVLSTKVIARAKTAPSPARTPRAYSSAESGKAEISEAIKIRCKASHKPHFSGSLSGSRGRSPSKQGNRIP